MSIQLPQKFLTKPAEIARWQWHLSQGKTNDTFTPRKSDKIFFRLWFQRENDGVKIQNAFFFQNKTIHVYGNSNMKNRNATKQKLLLAVSFSLQTGMLTTLGLASRSKHEGSQFSRSNCLHCRILVESTEKNTWDNMRCPKLYDMISW